MLGFPPFGAHGQAWARVASPSQLVTTINEVAHELQTWTMLGSPHFGVPGQAPGQRCEQFQTV